MCELSIILPSVRVDKCKQCVENIVKHTSLDYEIIVISSFYPYTTDTYNKIRWVEEKQPEGVVPAVNKGLYLAEGEYITTLCDEVVLTKDVYYKLYCEAINDYYPENFIYTPKVTPYFNFKYFNKQFAPFPFVKRSVINRIGFFMSPLYKSFYADPDFSMTGYSLDIATEEVDVEGFIFINKHDDLHRKNVSKYHAKDRQTFINRWGHLGNVIDP